MIAAADYVQVNKNVFFNLCRPAARCQACSRRTASRQLAPRCSTCPRKEQKVTHGVKTKIKAGVDRFETAKGKDLRPELLREHEV